MNESDINLSSALFLIRKKSFNESFTAVKIFKSKNSSPE